MRYIVNQTFEEIAIADCAKLIRTLTRQDIALFAAISGDVNPAHVDVAYAKESRFRHVIAHGLWSAMLFSTLLGTKLPGPGTIYLEQTLKFLRPVHIGDKITAMVTVSKKIIRKHRIVLACECKNQRQESVVIGLATVIAPTQKIKRKRVMLPEVGFLQP